MQIVKNVSLKRYSTMRLGGEAAYMLEVDSPQLVEKACVWAQERGLPVLMVGGGSNIIWRDEGFGGLLLANKIKRFDVDEPNGADPAACHVTVGGGESWDSVVERAVKLGLSGIEALSLIPGTAGATPVQNVGAYGQEIADTLLLVEAYDTHERRFVQIPNADCDFGYRHSRFNGVDKNRFLITSIVLMLSRQNPSPPFYPAVGQYLAERGIVDVTPQVIRDAVCDIRRHKLPDPKQIANSGSFFGNPVVKAQIFKRILATNPDVPHWEVPGGVKIPAAWLIEHSGFKNYRDAETGMATWASQPLVLVNESARSTAQLLKFRQKIVSAVDAKFGITLRQEPELLP